MFLQVPVGSARRTIVWWAHQECQVQDCWCLDSTRAVASRIWSDDSNSTSCCLLILSHGDSEAHGTCLLCWGMISPSRLFPLTFCSFTFFLFVTVDLFLYQIQTPIDCVTAIYTVLSRRRGHVTSDVPQPGTPAYIVKVGLFLICLNKCSII